MVESNRERNPKLTSGLHMHTHTFLHKQSRNTHGEQITETPKSTTKI